MKAPTLRQRAATMRGESKADGGVAAQPESRCRHYWEIETAAAQLSEGICRLCGRRKLFPNFLSDCMADPRRESYQEWVGKHEWEDAQAPSWNVKPWTSESTAIVQRSTEATRS